MQTQWRLTGEQAQKQQPLPLCSFDDVDVNDISLEDYIAVKPKVAVYVPHTAGRYQKKRFRKAQCPIVERQVRRSSQRTAFMHAWGGMPPCKGSKGGWKARPQSCRRRGHAAQAEQPQGCMLPAKYAHHSYGFPSLQARGLSDDARPQQRQEADGGEGPALAVQKGRGRLAAGWVLRVLQVYALDECVSVVKCSQVRIVKHAFEIINLLTDQNPIQVLVDAIINR